MMTRWTKKLLSLMSGLLLLLPSTNSAAQSGFAGFGTVDIYVTDPTGQRIPSVNLCLAMPGQTMGKMTDGNGAYKTMLPEGTTTIRLSRNGYANGQDTVSVTSGTSVVRVITLQPGQSTPLPSDCGIPATAVPGNSCDVITGIRVVSGTTTTNPTVTIQVDFSTWPHAYRVTEFSREESYRDNFNPEDGFRQNNVPWLRAPQTARNGLTISYPLTESYYGTHSIYVQTQRHQNGCVSQPRVVTVTLAPAKLQTYSLSGQAAAAFMNAAKNRGYDFVNDLKVVKPSVHCPPGHQAYAQPGVERASNSVAEEIRATFEVFIGPDFMPFWKLKSVTGNLGHPALSLEYDQNVPMTWEQGVTGPPPGSTLSSPRRTLWWKRKLFEIPYKHVQCKPLSQAGATIWALTLEGPAEDDPYNAMPPLRQRPLPNPPLNFQPSQDILTPNIVRPRGIDETEGTGGTEDHETVDKTPGPETTP